MARVLTAQIAILTDIMAGEDLATRRRAAIDSWSAMVGALILARSIDNAVLSDELLSEPRAWIDERKMPSHPAPMQDSRPA